MRAMFSTVGTSLLFLIFQAYYLVQREFNIFYEIKMVNHLGNFPSYSAVFICYIGMYSVIFISGYPSPTQKQLLQEQILNYFTIPIFASIVNVTKMLGLILFPCLVQTNISTNLIAISTCIVGAVGWMLIISAYSPFTLVSGVGLVGLYSGVVTIFLGAYVSEICLEEQRKVCSGGLGFSNRVGVFLAYALGIWLSFRWLAVVGLGFITLFACFLLVLPYSPLWCIRQGYHRLAVRNLICLHGKKLDVESEITKIENTDSRTVLRWRDSFSALKDFKVLKPILTVTSLAIFKELGGHAVMVSFSSSILENQQGMDSKVAALFYPLFLILGGLLSIFLVNVCKLKILLIVASSFQAVSHISMATYYFVSEHYLRCNQEPTQLCRDISFWPVCSIGLYAFGFSMGFGMIVYSLMGIMYTSHREISIAITEVTTNLTSYFVIYAFYFLLNALGGFWTFLLFAIVHIISVAYIYIVLSI